MLIIGKKCFLSLFLSISPLFSIGQSYTTPPSFSVSFKKPKRAIVDRLFNEKSSQSDAEKLREQARKLRQEISSFEQKKVKKKEIVQQSKEKEEIKKQMVKDTFSVVLPILKPDGSNVDEKVEFVPMIDGDNDSYITTTEGSLPLQMILGEEEFQWEKERNGEGNVIMKGSMVTVDELTSGGNAELAGVQVGDVLRAFTACKVEMEAPTWQLLAGGIGRPKTKRFIYVCDNRPFEEVMDAVASNRMDPEGRSILLVVERQKNKIIQTE